MTAFVPAPPAIGDIVLVRQRQYLVEDVSTPPSSPSDPGGNHAGPGEATLVSLSCLDDDAQGEPLEVLWEHELDGQIVHASWEQLGASGFDPPRRFGAYLHALRWNCVTATNPRLFQAPWRAGIEVMAYQLEPLRKALRLPRVNLFIADDVGLGKTVEAGLVLRELLMRQRVRRVVVAAPPSVVLQWRDELEQRFGLTFMIYDREYVARCRRERGFGVNPWQTHSRFIISHALLRDEDYASPLRDVLGDFAPGSMLILDEAHHAAPASSSRYAIDSHFTRAVRELARRFEHRLFLSATPHNGLSNSFSALLEILDPQRFLRGETVQPALRDAVMVRRLKSDLRRISGGFPERKVVQVTLRDLPADTPELVLAGLLDQYWELREQRLASLPPRQRAAQGLVMVNLQKRLLSSIEAFCSTLDKHRLSLERAAGQPSRPLPAQASLALLGASPGADDDRAEQAEDAVDREEEQVIEALALAGDGQPTAAERALLDRILELAHRSRNRPDARVAWLIDWIRTNLCPGLPAPGAPASGTPAPWLDARVVIFTEYAATKRYLEQQLAGAIGHTERAAERLRTFHGGMPDDLREDIKRAFNADPARHPLRILIATDAAREGVNLQNHCADLFHFDLPWNPSRMEQRNGRIDRKLQRAAEVRCHYFVYAQRDADRVTEVLAERTRVIHHELGSMPPVLEERITRTMAGGIGPRARAQLITELCALEHHGAGTDARARAIADELEGNREREAALRKQIDELRKILGNSRRALDVGMAEVDDEQQDEARSDEPGRFELELREVLNQSLAMAGAESLERVQGSKHEAYRVPALDRRPGVDPTWADTLDTLRSPRERDVPLWEWRKTAPIRPVIFRDPGEIDDDVVHLHLEHRLVQRLLGRFLAQGFVAGELSRACVVASDDAIPRVLLLGRLSLYGHDAARLHDEIVVVAARWSDADDRKAPLQPFVKDGRATSWSLLLRSLASARPHVDDMVVQRLARQAPRDVAELLPHVQARCDEVARSAITKLTERGSREARDMAEILEGQRARIERDLGKHDAPQLAFATEGFTSAEKEQLEANIKFWQRRLAEIPGELEREPARIERGYTVRAQRIEPVGIAYLWPVTG